MGNARLPSENSLSSYASSHSTLQEVFHGIHCFFPQVRYYVFCVHHDWLNRKGYSLFIVRSFQTVLDRFVRWPLLTSDSSATPHEVGCESTSRVHQTSPGKDVIYPSIYPLHLLDITFGRKDFVVSILIRWYLALYEVRVPQDLVSQSATFKFCIATVTLFVKLTTTSLFVDRDFHPIDDTYAMRTKKPSKK